jgi:hypothetical protein
VEGRLYTFQDIFLTRMTCDELMTRLFTKLNTALICPEHHAPITVLVLLSPSDTLLDSSVNHDFLKRKCKGVKRCQKGVRTGPDTT